MGDFTSEKEQKLLESEAEVSNTGIFFTLPETSLNFPIT